MSDKGIKGILFISSLNNQTKAISDVLTSILSLPVETLEPTQFIKTPVHNKRKLLIVDYSALKKDEKSTLTEHVEKLNLVTVIVNSPEKLSFSEIIQWKGIKGVFGKNCDIAQLKNGLMAILSGDNWLPRNVVNKLLDHYEANLKPKQLKKSNVVSPSSLTKRERQVLKALSESESNSQLADSLFISEHTVKTHLNNIFKKINVSNKLEALDWSKQHLD
ncbi:LuxR C-terminal-related transcriptional regulator [Vibrio sp. TRT 21S02]|uniref:LuxR C-terminal-related transcriptional regulator n=1 Tax=Vibrio sp. TRT 21S02 TaxID=3418507 RepID=UPI003CF25BD3